VCETANCALCFSAKGTQGQLITAVESRSLLNCAYLCTVGEESIVRTLFQDLCFGWRLLRKNPGFAAVAIATLTLGIGANTALFSVVNAVLLRPLPFRSPDSLCLLTERMPNFPAVGPSWQNFRDWRDQARSFERIAAARNTTFTLTGAGDPERLAGQMVSAGLFPLLGVSAFRGHTFTAAEDTPGAAPVVLLSYGFWQRRFGGSPTALGKLLTLDTQAYTVAGVLPPRFQFVQPADVYVPFAPWAARLPDDRSWHPGIIAVGRLKPDITIARARVELSAIARRLEQAYPVYDTGVGANVKLLHSQLVENVRPALLVLLGAVALVLLIACVNIANLLLARASSRSREIALRTALGAGRVRILRQLLTETTLLAAAGGLAGGVLAYLAIPSLVALAGTSIPDLGPVTADHRVLLFVGGAVMLASILCGLGPTLQTMRLDLRSALNEAARGSTGAAGQKKVRGLLVIGEIGFAIVLLTGAGLLLRSFERLQDVPPGFQPANLLVADVPLSQVAYPQAASRMNFFDRLLETVHNLPGVSSAGAAAFLPVSGGGSQIHFNIQGRPPKSAHDYIMAGYRPASWQYLQTLRTPLLRGRFLTERDTENAPFVVVINQAMARQYFGDASPLGKHMQLGALPDDQTPWMEIVGVVGDMKQNLAADVKAEMYIPYRQANAVLPLFSLSVVLRTAGEPHAAAAALRAGVRRLDPNQPVVKIRSMEENIAGSVSAPRFRAVLLAIFAGSALMLAVIGLYGVVTYSVTQRIPEIGIRLTLGAQPGQIVGMVVGEGLKLALAGVLAGIAGALALSRLLSEFLYSVGAADPLTYCAVASILLGVGLLASYLPARRATRIDPIAALRHE
jgi:putative ABC transport system permease protein